MSNDILYYNLIERKFSLKAMKTDKDSEIVLDFDILNQWKGKANIPPFLVNNIKIQLYPLIRKYTIVDVFVEDIKLLPISLMFRYKGHFSEHEIAFTQYGSGKNIGKSPHTLFVNKSFADLDYLERKELLANICDICNNYQHWIVAEAIKLLERLQDIEPLKWIYLDNVILTFRKYEQIAPELNTIMRPFIDKYCINCMKDFINVLPQGVFRNDKNKQNLAKTGDIIWQYIKDYRLLS